MSEATKAKAARLLREGRVELLPGEVREFRTTGDTGVYRTFIGRMSSYCTCPHGAKGAPGDCSHIEACLGYLLMDGKPEPLPDFGDQPPF